MPPFGWPDALATALDRDYAGQWMFTGSFAMFCLATVAGVTCRDPADIDVVMANAKQETVLSPVFKISNSLVYCACMSVAKEFGSLEQYKKQDEGWADNCLINQSRVKVDFGQESADLGFIATDCMRLMVAGRSYPLISATKLRQGKQSLSEATPTSKHTADVTTMDTIVQAMMPTAGSGNGATKNGCCVIL